VGEGFGLADPGVGAARALQDSDSLEAPQILP
jgi:hypothetical protein